MTDEETWGLEEGEEITSGRHALRLLGGGTRYEAYLAWDDTMHSLVVVKILRPHLTTDSRALRGLQEEAHALERVGHPVIVRCFDTMLDGPRPHVVLEHIEGPRLSTLIRKYGPLPPEQLIPLALQLTSALHYMSAIEMVHLDVKPRNIIMAAPPRLIDLSIAKSFEEARSIESPIGTDAYMAPEQCDPAGRGPIGPAADVWGLGVALFEAATGYRPFPHTDGEDDAARWPQLDMDPYDFPDRFPDAIAKPIWACLEQNPEDRPRADDVAAMFEALTAALPRKPALNRFRPRWTD